MVNDEYIKEVRDRYGVCQCGSDIEHIIIKEIYDKLYHVNMFGRLSEKFNPIITKGEEEILEVLCHPCFYKKYEKEL